jgi:hypothetical protein
MPRSSLQKKKKKKTKKKKNQLNVFNRKKVKLLSLSIYDIK